MLQEKHTNKYTKSLLVQLSLATVLGIFPNQAKAQNISCSGIVFGEIVTCGAPGTVTVRPDNTTTSSCVTVGGAPQSRAVCAVSQSFPIRPIQINVTSTSVLLNDGGNNMNVNAFNVRTNAGGTITTITGPFFTVPIGATLNVGATQAGGSYSGTVGVTAILQ